MAARRRMASAKARRRMTAAKARPSAAVTGIAAVGSATIGTRRHNRLPHVEWWTRRPAFAVAMVFRTRIPGRRTIGAAIFRAALVSATVVRAARRSFRRGAWRHRRKFLPSAVIDSAALAASLCSATFTAGRRTHRATRPGRRAPISARLLGRARSTERILAGPAVFMGTRFRRTRNVVLVLNPTLPAGNRRTTALPYGV